MSALSPSQPDRPFHGLWSLWDMLRIYADRFIFVINAFVALQKAIDGVSGDTKITLTPLDQELVSAMRHASKILAELEMPVSKRDIDALLRMYKRKEERRASDVSTLISTLHSSIVAEFQGKFIVAVSLSGAELFSPKQPLFGRDVATKFGSLAYEIGEAAKCLALERSTASAFHSIRCLEAGLRGVSRCLGIPDPTGAQRSWFNMLRDIKAEIDRRWPTNATKMSSDGRFFEEVHATLAAMQNPYRNSTMHLDQIYTEEDAKDLFGIVRGFMRKVAARCDENGEPKA